MKTVKKLNCKDKTVLLRVDFNISLKNGVVTNDTRIKEALPTIRLLLNKGAKIILVSHLGRPHGKKVKELSMAPVARRIQELLNQSVRLLDLDTRGIGKIIKRSPYNLFMLENIRYYPGEEINSPDFVKELASLADIFINDAFGTAHRAHASTVGITGFLPSYFGLLMEKEVTILKQVLQKAKKPFVLIIGGAKTPEKIRVIESLMHKTDNIILGGAIANTFLCAWGFGTGCSLVDHEMIEMAKVVFWKATQNHCALRLPLDLVISDPQRKKTPKNVDFDKMPKNMAAFDIGPKTITHFNDLIKRAKTIIWNGPMGHYEDLRFCRGTKAILNAIVKTGAFSIVGGGDTISNIKEKTFINKITHVSTGGGAMLEFLHRGTLPGIEAIEKQNK